MKIVVSKIMGLVFCVTIILTCLPAVGVLAIAPSNLELIDPILRYEDGVNTRNVIVLNFDNALSTKTISGASKDSGIDEVTLGIRNSIIIDGKSVQEWFDDRKSEDVLYVHFIDTKVIHITAVVDGAEFFTALDLSPDKDHIIEFEAGVIGMNLRPITPFKYKWTSSTKTWAKVGGVSASVTSSSTAVSTASKSNSVSSSITSSTIGNSSKESDSSISGNSEGFIESSESSSIATSEESEQLSEAGSAVIDDSTPGSNSNSVIILIAVAVGIVLIIGSALYFFLFKKKN